MAEMLDVVINGFVTLGFPIMACLAIGYYCYTLTKRMMEVIESNTKAMSELTMEVRDKMGDMDKWLTVITIALNQGNGQVTTDYLNQTQTPNQTQPQQQWQKWTK